LVPTTADGRRTTKDGPKTVTYGLSLGSQVTPQRRMMQHRASICRQLLYDTCKGQLLTFTIYHSICQMEWDAMVGTRRPRMAPVVDRATHGACPHHHDPQGQRDPHQGGRRQPRSSCLFSSLSSFFSLSSFRLSLLYCLSSNLPFPFNYKGGSRVSRRGDDGMTHIHPQPTETWELIHLSTVCNPYCKLKCK
jgi:hypothetical protein